MKLFQKKEFGLCEEVDPDRGCRLLCAGQSLVWLVQAPPALAVGIPSATRLFVCRARRLRADNVWGGSLGVIFLHLSCDSVRLEEIYKDEHPAVAKGLVRTGPSVALREWQLRPPVVPPLPSTVWALGTLGSDSWGVLPSPSTESSPVGCMRLRLEGL